MIFLLFTRLPPRSQSSHDILRRATSCFESLGDAKGLGYMADQLRELLCKRGYRSFKLSDGFHLLSLTAREETDRKRVRNRPCVRRFVHVRRQGASLKHIRRKYQALESPRRVSFVYFRIDAHVSPENAARRRADRTTSPVLPSRLPERPASTSSQREFTRGELGLTCSRQGGLVYGERVNLRNGIAPHSSPSPTACVCSVVVWCFCIICCCVESDD